MFGENFVIATNTNSMICLVDDVVTLKIARIQKIHRLVRPTIQLDSDTMIINSVRNLISLLHLESYFSLMTRRRLQGPLLRPHMGTMIRPSENVSSTQI